MSSLYELTDELAAAQRDLTEMLGNEVITPEEYDDTLSIMLDAHQVKTVGVIAYIKGLKAEAAMFKDEADRLIKRQNAASKQVEFYEGYLLAQMLKLEQTEAGEGVHTCKIKKGSMRCEITGDVAEKWLTIKTTTAPDKKAITRAIKAGQSIAGAAMVRAPDSIKLN